MITSISPESLTTLSDEALWALFDETHALLEELPLGSWERGIARANLRLVQDALDERRRLTLATTPAR